MTQEEVLELFEYRDDKLFRRSNNKEIKTLAKINGKNEDVHRIVYLYHHGKLPERIGFADGNRKNLKIENLIERKPYVTTGYFGVYFVNQTGKYRGQIKVNKTVYSVGSFSTPEEAAKEVDLANIEYNGQFFRQLNF